MSDVSFVGKVAVITGAGRGLGRAHARLRASRGASVVVNDYNVAVDGAPGDSNENPAETVAAELRASGATAVSNVDGIAKPDGAARIVAQAMESFGRLDILINNAGVGMCDPVQQEPGPLYERNMNTTLLGTVLMTRAAWPHLMQHRGRVLNVSSGAIFGSSWPDGSVLGSYSFAKAGVFAETRQMGRYGEQFGVKVNAVLPIGFSRTNADEDGAMKGGEFGEFFRRYLPAEAVAAGASMPMAPCMASWRASAWKGSFR